MKEVQFSHRDGDFIIVTDEDGNQLRLELNGELRQAIRTPNTNAAQFSPGEVQSMIREGMTLSEVSEKLGVGEDAIEPFAAPVVAELDYVKTAALSVLVVAQDFDETIPLADLLAHKLGENSVRVTKEASGWVVTAESGSQTAVFSFDPKNNWLRPTNDQAREIFEEQSAPAPFSVIDSAPEEPELEKEEPPADASSVATDLLEELQRRRAQKQAEPELPKPESSSKRPSLPSWDEIVFGAGEGKNNEDED